MYFHTQNRKSYKGNLIQEWPFSSLPGRVVNLMWWQIYPSVRDFYRQLHLLCGNDLKWLQKCYLCLKWLIVKAFNQPWWSLIPIHSPNLTFHWTIFQKDNVPMVHAISSNEKSNSSSHPFVASSFLVTFTLSLKNDQMWGFSLLFHLSSYRVISWSVVSLIFQIKCKWASWIWDRKKKSLQSGDLGLGLGLGLELCSG